MQKCPKCHLPRDSRICPHCGHVRKTPEETGKFLTGQVVRYKQAQYKIVRKATLAPAPKFPIAGAETWVQDPPRWWLRSVEEDTLICVDEVEILYVPEFAR